MLEDTLKQIGVLLSIGFGEAGSLIIANKIKLGGRVDTATDGKRVTGAFGFCDIRQFAEATECLQVRVDSQSRLPRMIGVCRRDDCRALADSLGCKRWFACFVEPCVSVSVCACLRTVMLRGVRVRACSCARGVLCVYMCSWCSISRRVHVASLCTDVRVHMLYTPPWLCVNLTLPLTLPAVPVLQTLTVCVPPNNRRR